MSKCTGAERQQNMRKDGGARSEEQLIYKTTRKQ